MTKQSPHTAEANPDKKPVAQKRPAKILTPNENSKERRSIFDESYAPVGSELRKAWSRQSRKS